MNTRLNRAALRVTQCVALIAIAGIIAFPVILAGKLLGYLP
jgi:hypothetical protein